MVWREHVVGIDSSSETSKPASNLDKSAVRRSMAASEGFGAAACSMPRLWAQLREVFLCSGSVMTLQIQVVFRHSHLSSSWEVRGAADAVPWHRALHSQPEGHLQRRDVANQCTPWWRKEGRSPQSQSSSLQRARWSVDSSWRSMLAGWQ